jgi:hypothetical protein
MTVTISNISKQIDENGKTSRTVTYLVRDHSNIDSAMSDPGVPTYGTSYSGTEPYLVVSGMSGRPYGSDPATKTYLVDVDFSRKTKGQRQPEPDNLLLAPTQWQMNFGATSEQFDQDIDGNPIINSSRERFNQSFSKLTPSVTFGCRKYVSGSQLISKLSQLRTYVGTVNSDSFKFGMESGKVLCLGGGPVGDFPEHPQASEIYEIAYAWEYREDGWKLRVKDEGHLVYNKFYNASSTQYDQSKRKYITPGTTEESTRLIALDGMGNKFGNPDGVTNPDGKIPYCDNETTAYAHFLIYKQYREKPFGALSL